MKAGAQGAGAVTIDPEKVEAFSRVMTEMLPNHETPALKSYLRAILGSVVVGDKTIQIVGSRDVLASAVAGRNFARQNVRGFVPEWRAKEHKDENSLRWTVSLRNPVKSAA